LCRRGGGWFASKSKSGAGGGASISGIGGGKNRGYAGWLWYPASLSDPKMVVSRRWDDAGTSSVGPSSSVLMKAQLPSPSSPVRDGLLKLDDTELALSPGKVDQL
jgi:hypothetical protein